MYDSNYTTFWKRQTYGDNKVINSCQGEEEKDEWGGGGGTGNFYGRETTLYATVMVDACHYTFVKTHKTYNTKSDPSFNLWTLTRMH